MNFDGFVLMTKALIFEYLAEFYQKHSFSSRLFGFGTNEAFLYFLLNKKSVK